MTREEKDLLIKDFCARFPYGVKLEIKYQNGACRLFTIYHGGKIYAICEGGYPIESNLADCKPYLFPLSSMTEEQLFEVQEILGKNEIKIEDGFIRIVDSEIKTISYSEILALLEWFYKNHFDINNLIPEGLAIDATGLNIY